MRYAARREILAAKFSGALAEKLAGTGDTLLVEGNTWCDQHWVTAPAPATANGSEPTISAGC